MPRAEPVTIATLPSRTATCLCLSIADRVIIGRVRRLNAREWIDAFSERLGVPAPDTEQFKLILDLAGEAAHASERVAAPVACWVAATAGVPLEEALRVAGEVAHDDG
jgi:uncharacterized protein DUF6457